MLAIVLATFARHLRVVAIGVAAAMLGIGGAAATVVQVADSSTPEVVTATTATVADDQGEDAETAVVPLAVETAIVPLVVDPLAPLVVDPLVVAPVVDTVDPVEACDAATSHGEYVSAVARGEILGIAVSEAAHSDCGKTAPAEVGTTETTVPLATDETDVIEGTEKVKKVKRAKSVKAAHTKPLKAAHTRPVKADRTRPVKAAGRGQGKRR